MKKLRRFLAFVLCAALCFLLLTGCGSRDTIRFKMIAELNQEEFCVAFRKGDPLCDIFTAALKELSADGQISRLSAQYLGTDYTCMEALPGALQLLETQPEPGRKLRIGVQDGIAPISSSRDDGSFGGLIPDLAQLVAEKLGWTFEYMVINSDNVAAELGSGNIDCAWMAASFSGSSSSVSLSPGWLRNTHELVVRSDSRYTRKNSQGKRNGRESRLGLVLRRSFRLLCGARRRGLRRRGDRRHRVRVLYVTSFYSESALHNAERFSIL